VSLSQGDERLPCPGAVDLGIFLPHLAGVIIDGVVAAAGLVSVLVRAKTDAVACPACGSVSGRVHSRYGRRLADAAIGGRRVVIRLTARRFFCAFPGCAHKTFAEQVPGLTVRYGRTTALLARMQRDIAVALAGRAGCRLARELGVPASRIKMIKRQMFGRAGLPLLRKRVLLTVQNRPPARTTPITR
jgi:transposase